jgi:calcineurin-like phosphoesterase family protein
VTIWLISDTHFGHANFLNFRDEAGNKIRPFSSVEEMDDTMMQNWNKVVKTSDHVYHLGDFCMRANDLSWARSLNGHLRLVRGNHDTFKTRLYLAHGFEEIHGMRVLSDVCLTHCPIHPLSINKRWHGNIHGHIHEKRVPLDDSGVISDPRYLNVSVEQINYTPITLEDAIARLKAQQE